MSQLANLGKPPDTYLGEHWVLDGFGFQYRFSRYTIESCPSLSGAVYAFVSFRPGILIHTPVLEYVGRAVDTHDRLSDHERLTDARRRGASEVWVHRPQLGDPISFYEAERRMIHTYDPPMNKQKPMPLGLFGLLGSLQGQYAR